MTGTANEITASPTTGDVVLTPTPTYPIHMYSFIIAGGEVRPDVVAVERRGGRVRHEHHDHVGPAGDIRDAADGEAFLLRLGTRPAACLEPDPHVDAAVADAVDDLALDLLLPPTPVPSGGFGDASTDARMAGEQATATREKLREQLRAGKLDALLSQPG